MPVVQKTYFVNPIKQEIDLNGDVTDFNLTFTATSKNGEVFDLVVADKSTKDTNPNLEYKKVTEGTISGNIVS